MKKTLLLFIFLSALHSMRASDTLTIRQIYNFDVGDTFDYLYHNECNVYASNPLVNTPYNYSTICRYIIVGKYTSLNSDTHNYIRHFILPSERTDTIGIAGMDSLFTSTREWGYQLNFDTLRLADGRMTNRLYTTPFEGGIDYKYGDGTGLMHGNVVIGDVGSSIIWTIESDTLLLYYSKGNSDTFGTPYYIPQQAFTSPHYTPIPEQCAHWIRHYEDDSLHINFYEQISTGNKVQISGHVFVELYCRYFDAVRQELRPDSMIGYFSNDTAGMKVYFRHTIMSADSILYDFSLYPGQTFTGLGYPYKSPINTGTWYMGGTDVRTMWSYSEHSPAPIYRSRSYVDGIGSLQGFVLVHDVQSASMYAYQSLESFCVCGQSIHPSHSNATCYELTEIMELKNLNSAPKVYPNPTSDILHLSFPDANSANVNLIITDILAQQVYTSTISDIETTLDISSLPSGIYTWRIVSDNTILKTGKIVKQ